MPMKVTKSEFVDVWIEAHKGAHNIAWLARRLNMSHQGANQRAARLRSSGIDLPRLPRYDEGEKNQLNYRIAKGMAS